jgi:DNA invertase Pin-like site-specific DNA recombinase
METTKLKQFAQYARRSLIEQVSNKLQLVLAEDSVARRESCAPQIFPDRVSGESRESAYQRLRVRVVCGVPRIRNLAVERQDG